ncbi:hypothetical protein LU290_03220 [Moraxella nasibovis]|uniref:hypothetical protein n=1 Tax=Moraxella nasibovis TaxID=2904120 RepID=UPI0024103A73|nr:hypothetical protein [Moraxella nasibovis]WFF39246.1 hypothetical protein LU290_03220 [Moraxella nasibovis]
MTQLIKFNDLVYLPSVSNKLYKVGAIGGTDGKELLIFHGGTMFRINAGGCLFKSGTRICLPQQFAFLATPENKEKLEQVYGKLEDIPEDLAILQEFIGAIEAFHDAIVYRYEFGCDDKGVPKIKDKLIQMFKERGKK